MFFYIILSPNVVHQVSLKVIECLCSVLLWHRGAYTHRIRLLTRHVGEPGLEEPISESSRMNVLTFHSVIGPALRQGTWRRKERPMLERTKGMVMAERMVLLLINQKVPRSHQMRIVLPKVSRFSKSGLENETS